MLFQHTTETTFVKNYLSCIKDTIARLDGVSTFVYPCIFEVFYNFLRMK